MQQKNRSERGIENEKSGRKLQAGDYVKINGAVKYRGCWLDIVAYGTVELTYPGSALVRFDRVYGGATCAVRNKYINIIEEAR